MSYVLITGAAGYIGSITTAQLQAAGFKALCCDNFSNSDRATIQRIEEINGLKVDFFQQDLRDIISLRGIFQKHKISAVIHFAGLKAVGESHDKPLDYYDNNVVGTINLLKVMAEFDCYALVFSSSATVYGEEAPVPYLETTPCGRATSPYGATKRAIELILEDCVESDARWRISNLRYFNPIGAHSSGKLGENPNGIPNNLLPYLLQVANGDRDYLTIFGSDYATKDGTCERDYLHVMDLADGHIAALEHLKPGLTTYNLGSGKARSVLEIVDAFTEATGIPINYKFGPRRQGDLPAFWASADKAYQELGWKAERSLNDMMIDSWKWQQFLSLNSKGRD